MPRLELCKIANEANIEFIYIFSIVNKLEAIIGEIVKSDSMKKRNYAMTEGK